MPQASDELRDKMLEYFPDEPYGIVDDYAPYEFLIQQGWKEEKFILSSPWSLGSISNKEYHCLLYLIHEWDWGYKTEIMRFWDE